MIRPILLPNDSVNQSALSAALVMLKGAASLVGTAYSAIVTPPQHWRYPHARASLRHDTAYRAVASRPAGTLAWLEVSWPPLTHPLSASTRARRWSVKCS